MQEKVAILIPTYNRPKFILDLCRFYSIFNFSNYIIILGDSSKPAVFNENARIINNFPNVKIIHVKCPKKGPHEALLAITKIALTRKIKYCMFTGDDDYIYVNSLGELTKYLRTHSKFRSVRGRALLIGVNKRRRDGSLEKITFYQKYWHHKDISQTNPIKRLEFLAENYLNLQFAMHRTSEFESQLAAKTGVSMGFFQEYSESFCSAILGKSKFIDVPYLIRLSHNYYGGNSYETIKKDNSNNALKLFFKLIYTDEIKIFTNNVISSMLLKKEYKINEIKFTKEILANKIYKSLVKISKNNESQENRPFILKFAIKKVQKFRLKTYSYEIKIIEGFISSSSSKHNKA